MFCKNCGAEMNDTAKFCPKCGADITGESKKSVEVKEDSTVKFQLKPKFNWGYKILCSLGVAILWTIIIVFWIFGSIDDVDLLMAVLPVISFIPMIIIGIVIVCVAIKLIFEKIQYDTLEYNFYATKAEYIDGFLNKEQKELKYKYIREVTMTQNILERIFHIGTIRIFTNASSGMAYNNKHNKMYGKNGLAIHCIENVKEQYQKVKDIIDEGTPEE